MALPCKANKGSLEAIVKVAVASDILNKKCDDIYLSRVQGGMMKALEAAVACAAMQ